MHYYLCVVYYAIGIMYIPSNIIMKINNDIFNLLTYRQLTNEYNFEPSHFNLKQIKKIINKSN